MIENPARPALLASLPAKPFCSANNKQPPGRSRNVTQLIEAQDSTELSLAQQSYLQVISDISALE